MKYYQDLYLGEGIRPERMRWRIRFHRIPLVYYIITFASHSEDQLEILQGSILQQPYYRKHPPFVIGVARNYEDAVSLVQKILSDTMTETKGVDMRAYLMGKAEHTC